MAVKKKDESKQEAEIVTFTKEQIVSAKRYMHKKDVVNVVLKDGQSYTLEKVDELIDNFMKGKVK
jgi:hypothetical protein